MGNHSLVDFTGLDSVLSIGGDLFIQSNAALKNFHGLELVAVIEGSMDVKGNEQLESFSGLDSVASVGNDFWIESNKALTSFQGLNNLKSIDGFFWIYTNKSLESFAGLDSLTTIDWDIEIYSNDAMTTLAGLDNLDPASIDGLTITHNDLLSTCEIASICAYLADPNADASIGGNATGCSSREEVEDSCEVVSVDPLVAAKTFGVKVLPNPFDSFMHIYIKSAIDQTMILTIHDSYGRTMETLSVNMVKGTQVAGLSADQYAPGLYYLRVYGKNGVANTQLILKR
jgi:hypothetical protein